MNRRRSRTRSPPRPPSPSNGRKSRPRRNDNKRSSYAQSRSPRRRREVRLVLCVFHSSSHKWSTEPLRFDPSRINDRQLWSDIRYTFRTDLQKPWRRLFGVKKVKGIVPISYSPNGVPIHKDPKDYPASQTFMHAYHHPDQIRPDHRWVDYFTALDENDEATNGLEFVEGLWADKLAAFGVIATIAIITVSIVWCVLGGNLQTVFTVMSFVLTLVAAQLALVTLYYQVALPGGSS